jgi:hypothetical protein
MATDSSLVIENDSSPAPTLVRPKPEVFESPATTPEAIDAQVAAVNKLMGATEVNEPNNVISFRTPNSTAAPVPAPEASPAPPLLSVTEQHAKNMRRETNFERPEDEARRQADATPIPGKGTLRYR